MTRLLVITRSAWAENNTGITLSNLLGNWAKTDIANLYCRAEKPKNDICDIYFRISEFDILRAHLTRASPGVAATYAELTDAPKRDRDAASSEQRLYARLRRRRWHILLWGREAIWKNGDWKSQQLTSFLREFSPDVILMTIYDCFYMHELLAHIKEVTAARVILFTGDDTYSLRQISFSPLFWVNRLALRRRIRGSVRRSDVVLAMSEDQRIEYEQEFAVKTGILRRGILPKAPPRRTLRTGHVVNIVYAGNLVTGERWRTLVLVAQAVQAINSKGLRARLLIYSADALTSSMSKQLLVADQVMHLGVVPSDQVPGVLADADIVLHAESFAWRYRLQTRHSFSTKMVDYFEAGRCIFAVGWSQSNSIKYLISNDAAIVATRTSTIERHLENLVSDQELRNEYERKAWRCGVQNHDLARIRHDFHRLVSETCMGETEGSVAAI